ncbi:hypothetical protein [Ancylobacter polymorphus]|uniref:Uncharacterized protein n=1 Tax=Ancylobacter polymorphus TaxID=223390 RepID=A0A9E6ZRG6_9HYPH|nr:hypothetical protein [Ancylobacter polymorphus]UOK70406.1 hypothetical protein K9D25_16990 [Ancylobacter polymorphus]
MNDEPMVKPDTAVPGSEMPRARITWETPALTVTSAADAEFDNTNPGDGSFIS